MDYVRLGSENLKLYELTVTLKGSITTIIIPAEDGEDAMKKAIEAKAIGIGSKTEIYEVSLKKSPISEIVISRSVLEEKLA